LERIFGPVPSRRLGRSLGIDVVPYKTCTFDCIYCECGGTTNRTCSRSEFYPLDDILEELEGRLSEIPQMPDVVTLSGAGEPTLYSRTGELIRRVKGVTGIPVAVITNSSLLSRPELREEVSFADIVLPSLDSVIEETFSSMNRPHEECDIGEIQAGLEEFTRVYTGKVYLEIMLLEGFNTDERNLSELKLAIEGLRVDEVQLNTAVRPGTVKGIGPLDKESLISIKEYFGSACEVVAETPARASHEDLAAEQKVISMLERRPCTAEDMHNSLGIPVPGLAKLLSELVSRGTIKAESHGGKIFYTAIIRG